ncbi:hypothetical protein ACE0DR_04350 [Azotobacter sp. CWF10]
MRDGLVRLGRDAGDAEHHDDFLDGQPLDQLAGHLRLAIRDQGTDVACDDALAETINGLYKAEVIHRQSWKSAAALEELEAARLAFRALVEASLPKPPAEKSPHHGHDYEDAPEWATHPGKASRATGSTSMPSGTGTASAIGAARTNDTRRSARSFWSAMARMGTRRTVAGRWYRRGGRLNRQPDEGPVLSKAARTAVGARLLHGCFATMGDIETVQTILGDQYLDQAVPDGYPQEVRLASKVALLVWACWSPIM